MIIEFPCFEKQGSLYAAGRAEEIFAPSGEICRSAIQWRKPLRWEEDLWQSFASPSVKNTDGPAMLGEGGTLYFWEEADPYWIIAESEEEEEILFLERFPWASLQSICSRPDCRTAVFRLPAPLLQIRNAT